MYVLEINSFFFTAKQDANYREDTKSSKFKVTEFHEGEKRIPSNDNCDYILVVNYLLIIIPNHSDCTFGTIFFSSFIQTMSRDGKDVRKKKKKILFTHTLQVHTRIFHSRPSSHLYLIISVLTLHSLIKSYLID